ASKYTTATDAGVVMGTFGYMSPEQVKAESVDARSDIFALGVILYEMLSGQRPFRGDSPGETMAAILKEDPSDLSVANRNISPGLERLVRHCLEKKPERRFQSARDLAYDLEALSTPSGAALPTGTLAASRQRLRALLAVAGVLALGILAWWGLLKIRREAPVSYTRLTFRRGTVYSARFAPDGQTVVYCAAWEGQPARIYATRAGGVESRDLQLPDSRILAVSSTGELACLLGVRGPCPATGTLRRLPLGGGAPGGLLESVWLPDWSPDGRELATVHRVGEKDRIEFPIGKVLYETADQIGSMRFSPRGDLIAITDYAGAVRTLDLSGKVTTISTGWSWAAAAWRPDGREVWLGGYRRVREEGRF